MMIMLAKQEKRILKHGREVASANYVRIVRSRVVKKSQKAIDDLLFIAAELPEQSLRRIFTQEKMAKLIRVLLKADLEVITSQRLPPSMGRERPKKSRRWAQLAGPWRDKSGGLLKRPDLHRRTLLAYAISKATHESLSELCRFKHLKSVVWLMKKERKIKISVSNLRRGTMKSSRYNFKTKEVEEVNEQVIILRPNARTKSDQVEDISMIVIKGE